MAGYTKLFSSLIHSTIWREADHIRIVWITMLAMADREGVVEASVPGLADASRVTLGQCREALASLSSPDPDSRTPDFEGRRIAQVDGGWVLLNHAKYREQLSREQKRAATAARVRKHRQEKRESVTSSECNTSGNAFGSECNANVTPVTKSNASNAIPSPSPSPSPTTDPKEESKHHQQPAAHTPRRDPFGASFARPNPAASELFEAWRSESGKTGATMDSKRSEFFGRLVLEGVTKDHVIEVVSGAKLDDWAVNTAKLSPSAILGSAEQREKYSELAKSPQKPTSSEPVPPYYAVDVPETPEQLAERTKSECAKSLAYMARQERRYEAERARVAAVRQKLATGGKEAPQ